MDIGPENREGHPRKQTLADQFADVIGTVSELPADMAENHDHYLHGAPKYIDRAEDGR